MRAAIAVAEELSFSRAAKRLHLSQPAVTKYIAELEEILGITLFLRDHHVVSLTDAGRAYVEEARVAVLHSDRAIQTARAAGQNADLILNIGRTPYADPFFASTLVAMRLPLFPRLKLNLSSRFSCELAHDVLTGELDAAVVVEPPESGALTGVTIDRSPFYIVFSREDPLAVHRSITLELLAGRRWLLFERAIHPLLYDLIRNRAQSLKVVPSDIQHFLVPEETIPMLIDPGAVVIVPKCGAVRIARNGLTLRPLDDEQLIMRTLPDLKI